MDELTAEVLEAERGTDVAEAVTRGGRLLILRGIQYALGFASGVMIARALGPDGRGEYALALNLAVIAWVFSHLSVELAVGRLLGRKEASWIAVARVCASAAAVLGGIGMLVTAAVGLLWRESLLGGASQTDVLLAAATIPFTLMGQLAAALLFRLGRLGVYGFTLVGVAAIQLALLAAIEFGAGLTPEATLAVNLATVALGAGVLTATLGRSLGITALVPRPPKELFSKVLRTGAALHVSSVALFLNLRVDLLLVGAMLSLRDAGLYSLAAMLAELVVVATSTIGLAALQSQTELDDESAVGYTLDFARQSLALAFMFAVPLAALAYPLVLLAYGAEWTSAVAPFVILTIGSVALAVEGPVRGVLLRLAPPIAISRAAVIAAAVNVCLNLALIPTIGIVGSAIASAASYWLAAVLMLRLLRRTTGAPVQRALSVPRHGDVVPTTVRRLRRRPGEQRCVE
jgi:O-antigen/teichoic acid export membrane protein